MAQAKLPCSPTGVPQKNMSGQIRGDYLKLGILLKSLVNAGEKLSDIAIAVRTAEVAALHDGIGQEERESYYEYRQEPT